MALESTLAIVLKSFPYGDTSKMFSIGEISIKAKNLIDATYESMIRTIKILKPTFT